jgi:hypothetical protein
MGGRYAQRFLDVNLVSELLSRREDRSDPLVEGHKEVGCGARDEVAREALLPEPRRSEQSLPRQDR